MTPEERDALRRELLLRAAKGEAAAVLHLELLDLVEEAIKRIELTRILIAQLDILIAKIEKPPNKK
jgi:hypothetical protein